MSIHPRQRIVGPPRRGVLPIIAVACTLALAACAGGDVGSDGSVSEDDEETPTRDDSASASAPTTRPSDDGAAESGTAYPSEGGPVEQVPSRVLDPVLAAASDRTDVPASDIAVVRAQGVTFSDGSLGCPVPGRQYTQALVDGWWVVIEADGETLDYRIAEGGRPRLCEGGGTTPAPRQDT